MKVNHLYVFAFGILLLFSSCKKENTELILGTWDYNNAEVQLEANNNMLANVVASFISAEIKKEKSDEFTITFNKDGKADIAISKNGNRNTFTETYSIEDGYLVMSLKSILAFVGNINTDLNTQMKYSLTKDELILENSVPLENLEDIISELLSETGGIPGYNLESIGLKKMTLFITFNKKK